MEQCKHDPQSHRYTRAIVNGTGKYTQIDVGCLWAQPVYKHLVLNGQHQMAFLSYVAEFEHIGSMFQGKRKELLRDWRSDADSDVIRMAGESGSPSRYERRVNPNLLQRERRVMMRIPSIAQRG